MSTPTERPVFSLRVIADTLEEADEIAFDRFVELFEGEDFTCDCVGGAGFTQITHEGFLAFRTVKTERWAFYFEAVSDA